MTATKLSPSPLHAQISAYDFVSYLILLLLPVLCTVFLECKVKFLRHF